MSLHRNISGVTVNGRPLGEYVANTQPKRIRNKAFTNGISRNLNLPEKDEPDFTQWVLMKGVKYLRAAKEPFAVSGKSILGALQYDPDTDKIKCHECGEWFVNYGHHRRKNPKHPSPQQYKKNHALLRSTGLAGLRWRATLSRATAARHSLAPSLSRGLSTRPQVGVGRPRGIDFERQNAGSNCPVQLIHRLKLLASQLGRCPIQSEIKFAGISLRSIRYFHGSVAKALTRAGVSPNASRRAVLSTGELLDRLVSLNRILGRWPRLADVRKSGLAGDQRTYIRRFGSLAEAVALAESKLTQASQSS